MRNTASFGGSWTEDKLRRIDKYLRAYTKIFDRNIKARYFTTVYVDAFASTGTRAVSSKEIAEIEVIPEQGEAETQNFLRGSTRVALEVEPRFDQYLFIERSVRHSKELESLKSLYPDKADSMEIVNADANHYLTRWCAMTDWSKTRAVLFLDPFGMQVEWSLLEAIAKTQAIDVWLLFPIGMGVNRLLTKSQPPPEAWANRLTKTLGSDEWRGEFYPARVEATLFGDVETQSKDTDFARIATYFVRRLETLFPGGVAQNPLLLRNSTNTPLYLLCFATGTKKDSPRRTAIKIAENILKR